MRRKDGFHLERVDLPAGDVDETALAACQVESSGGIKPSDVGHVDPSVGIGERGERREVAVQRR